MRALPSILSHLALLLTILFLVPTSGYAQQGTVTGQVVAQPTGEPVEGAAVSIQDTDLQSVTSGGGQFRIEGVPAGTRVVQARLDGYEAQGRAASVPIGDAAKVQLELQPKSSPDRGTSSDAEVMKAVPEGTILKGEVIGEIEQSVRPNGFAEGVVAVIDVPEEAVQAESRGYVRQGTRDSPSMDDVIGVTYTSSGGAGAARGNECWDSDARIPATSQSGCWAIEGLPSTGTVAVVAFLPRVKRLMGAEVVDLSEGRNIHMGTIEAWMDVPTVAPEQLERSGQAALAPKGKALAALVLSGWLAEITTTLQDMNYDYIDQLTNQLCEYVQEIHPRSADTGGCEYGHDNDPYIGSEPPTAIVTADAKDDTREGRNTETDADSEPVLNIKYYDQDRSRHYVFFERDGQLVSQQNDGDAHTSYIYGIKTLEPDPDEPGVYRVQWASGHGGNTEHLVFGGRDAEGSYVDVTCDGCNEPERFVADPQSRSMCSVSQAASLAAEHFSPTCSSDPASYEPFGVISLNEYGREAYIMRSCAGPGTNGKITYLVVERRASCEAIGSMTLRDPEPEFRVLHEVGNDPLIIGGDTLTWPYPKPLEVETSRRGTHEYRFDLDDQEYNRTDYEGKY